MFFPRFMLLEYKKTLQIVRVLIFDVYLKLYFWHTHKVFSNWHNSTKFVFDIKKIQSTRFTSKLRIFLFLKLLDLIKNISITQRLGYDKTAGLGMTRYNTQHLGIINMVEMRGFEPLCKTLHKVLSTCLFHLWSRARY